MNRLKLLQFLWSSKHPEGHTFPFTTATASRKTMHLASSRSKSQAISESDLLQRNHRPTWRQVTKDRRGHGPWGRQPLNPWGDWSAVLLSVSWQMRFIAHNLFLCLGAPWTAWSDQEIFAWLWPPHLEESGALSTWQCYLQWQAGLAD